jgi:hypothetical protein
LPKIGEFAGRRSQIFLVGSIIGNFMANDVDDIIGAVGTEDVMTGGTIDEGAV